MRTAFLYVTFFNGLLPLFLYLWLKRKQAVSDALNGIRPFLWLTAVASLYEPIVTLGLKVNSLHWFRIYNILEFAALYYFYRDLLAQPIYRKLILFFGILFIAGICLIYYFDIRQLLLEAIYSVFVTLFVFVFTSLWIGDIFSKASIPPLWKVPAFNFIAGFLLYYASTIFFFLFSEAILSLKIIDYQGYWLLNIGATFILQIFLITGVWNGKRI